MESEKVSIVYVEYPPGSVALPTMDFRATSCRSTLEFLSAEVNHLGITFSHDGNLIYYVRRERNAATGTLYRKPVLGGAEKKLFVNVDSLIVSIDFMTVPTATFRVLYVLIVLAHDRRRVVHFNITTNPTAACGSV
jgi:hypothetical protein